MAQISELFRHTVYEKKIVQEIAVMCSKDMMAVFGKGVLNQPCYVCGAEHSLNNRKEFHDIILTGAFVSCLKSFG